MGKIVIYHVQSHPENFRTKFQKNCAILLNLTLAPPSCVRGACKNQIQSEIKRIHWTVLCQGGFTKKLFGNFQNSDTKLYRKLENVHGIPNLAARRRNLLETLRFAQKFEIFVLSLRKIYKIRIQYNMIRMLSSEYIIWKN